MQARVRVSIHRMNPPIRRRRLDCARDPSYVSRRTKEADVKVSLALLMTLSLLVASAAAKKIDTRMTPKTVLVKAPASVARR